MRIPGLRALLDGKGATGNPAAKVPAEAAYHGLTRARRVGHAVVGCRRGGCQKFCFLGRMAGEGKHKAVYLAIGVRCSGHREVLGIWIEQTVGAKFWLRVRPRSATAVPTRC
jgi:hypothetical protein